MNEFYKSEIRFFDGESDLACERRRADTTVDGVEYTCYKGGGFSWERIKISTRAGEESIGRPMGHYDTLCTKRMDLLDESDIEDMANELAGELCSIFEKASIVPERLLIIGLGNAELTPDAVGPKTAELVNATMHLRRLNRKMFVGLECSEIAVFTPGVMAKTGIESTDIVNSVCDRVNPDAVIAIDSIASRSAKRLGRTIQISDTGIFPGSGIGNNRRPLNEDELGIPVIAIGVPTVVNAKTFQNDKEQKIHPDDCDDFEADMFVSPREIDTIVSVSSRIIALGINQAFGIF